MKTFVVAVAATMLLVPSAQGQIVPKPMFAFERLTWKMTRAAAENSLSRKNLQPDQVPASMPAKYREKLRDTTYLTLQYVDTLYSQPFDIEIVFDKKTLHLLRIGAKIVSPDKQQIRSVTDALINRFGKPTEESSMAPGGYLRTWILPTTKLSAMTGSFPFGSSGLYYINYTPLAKGK